MALEDKIKWNNKYKNTPTLLEERPQSNKLNEVITYAKGKEALDVACGSGRNSIFLANNNFHVTSIDISEVALEKLNNKKHKNITTKIVDLDNFDFKDKKYDLIIMTNFLDRKLIPHLADALKKDALLIIETYMEDDENEKPSSNPDFLLKKGELKSFFNDNFEVLDYEEFLNETQELYKMMKQSIVLKKL